MVLINRISHKLLTHRRKKGRCCWGRGLSPAVDRSGTDDDFFIEFIGFFVGSGLGRGVRVGFPLVSSHLISEVGDVLIDPSCHGIFTGSLCEGDSCAVLGEMGRLAWGTLQATAGDHDRDRAFLDKVVGGGTEEDAGRRG